MARIRINLVLIFLVILALIAPDFLAQMISDKDNAALSGKFMGVVLLFSICLSFAPRYFVLICLGFFAFIEIIQFCNLFYYGTLITSTKFKLLFTEIDEVVLVAKGAFSFLFWVPFLVLFPYGLLVFVFFKFENNRIKNALSVILILLCLCIVPYRVNKAYHGANYYPDPSDHSLRNSLYAVGNCVYNLIYPTKLDGNVYQEYKISPIENYNSENINIILIIGESSNYSHMSLFGYERKTNPLLEKFIQDKNFIYLKGLSGGVSTPVSLPLLLNVIYEPNNAEALTKKEANLFKLAKSGGYKTFYVSAQTGALLTNLGIEYIDYKMFRGKDPILFNRYQDEALLKIIPELDYSESNFIVINQRNAHAPYEENYEYNPKFQLFNPNKADFKQFRIDTYDNAMYYNDFILSEIFKFYLDKFNGPTYIFFTSDHGEVLDSTKVAFGHAELKEEVAEVPFLAYIKNGDNSFLKSLKQPVFHYELGKIIAKLLGFEIINPNEREDIFYIHGTDLDGQNEYIEYHK